jgi:regulator of protease activity HflC (stomatin/prohibitin superfamily)
LKLYNIAFAVLLATVGITGCSYVQPDAGHESVIIRKPWFFGHGGVDQTPVKTGSKIVAWSTDYVEVDMQPQRADVEFLNFMTSDGVPVEVDATLILQVTDSVEMITKFGPDWYSKNIEPEFGNRVRQEVRQHGLQDMAINTSAVEAVQTNAAEAITRYIKTRNMPLVVNNVIIGKVLPPDAVKDQRIATAQQEQRLQTETQRQKAEDAREGAEASRAKADNAYRLQMQLSPEQFVQLNAIEAQKEVCLHNHCEFITTGVPVILGGK